MTKTLNLSDHEARLIHHLIENELQHEAGAVREDDDYREELEHIKEKLES